MYYFQIVGNGSFRRKLWKWLCKPGNDIKRTLPYICLLIKGAVHSFNIWAKSLANNSLMTVLSSRFSPNMSLGPVIFKLVSYRSTIFRSLVIIFKVTRHKFGVTCLNVGVACHNFWVTCHENCTSIGN